MSKIVFILRILSQLLLTSERLIFHGCDALWALVADNPLLAIRMTDLKLTDSMLSTSLFQIEMTFCIVKLTYA